MPTIKVKIFPGGQFADSSTWGVPVDVSAYVRYPGSDGGQAITYSGGRQNEANRVDASRMALTLDNRDGRFSMHNPLGPYYGSLRRNTPITVSTVAAEDAFARTGATLGPGWTTGSFTTNGTSAVSALAAAGTITRPLAIGSDAMNCDGRVTLSVNQVSTGGSMFAGAQTRAADAINAVMLRVEFTTAGNVNLRMYRVVNNALAEITVKTSALAYAAGDKVRLRWSCDGPTVRAKVWKPANPALPDADEPAAWTVSGAPGTILGAQSGIIAWRDATNTNTGQNVTVNDFLVEGNEFVGQVNQWPIDWDITGRNSWSAIVASGVFQRLQQGGGTLMSPLRRQLGGARPTAYWPLEDGAGATVFGPTTPGATVATYTAVNPSADTSLPGALSAPTFSDPNGRIRGSSRKTQGSAFPGGFVAVLFTKLGQATTGTTILNSWSGVGRVVTWQIILDAGPTRFTLRGYESDGTLTVDTFALFNNPGTPLNPLGWIVWNLTATGDGATVNYSLDAYQVGGTGTNLIIGSFASGSIPKVNAFVLGGQELNGASFAHVWMGEYPLSLFGSTLGIQAVANGYPGEAAGTRLTRIAGEMSVPLLLEGVASEGMGPQRSSSFLDNLRYCEDADMGVLYEHGSGLGYRPRANRYALPSSFTLSRTAGEVADVPRPLADDSATRNQWTISRDQGSSVTASDPAHIAAEGLYDDSATLNISSDNNIADHATWRVYLGTRPEARWPSLSIDLLRNPRLAPFWRSSVYGQRFKATLLQSQVLDQDPDVILEGWSVALWPHGWRVQANCSPAAPWDVGVVVTTAGAVGEYVIDSEDSTLDTAVPSSTFGSIQVVNANGRNWAPTATTAGWAAFNIKINGEVMTVTNVGAVFSSTKQTLTVTRGVNGVARVHPAGSSVVVNPAPIIGL